MALTVMEIPLQPQAQTLSINLGGTTYTLTLRWRTAAEGGWVMDIADAAKNPIVSGIPLVTGADLLAQYRYLGFVGSLIVQTDHDPDAVPTFANLGQTAHLYYVQGTP